MLIGEPITSGQTTTPKVPCHPKPPQIPKAFKSKTNGKINPRKTLICLELLTNLTLK